MGITNFLNRNVLNMHPTFGQKTAGQLIKDAWNMTYMGAFRVPKAHANDQFWAGDLARGDKNYNGGDIAVDPPVNNQRGIAKFLGLPSSDLNPRNIWNRFSDSNATNSPLLNLILSPIFIAVRLAVTVVKFGINVVKLGTEFVPLAIKNLFNKAFYHLMQQVTGQDDDVVVALIDRGELKKDPNDIEASSSIPSSRSTLASAFFSAKPNLRNLFKKILAATVAFVLLLPLYLAFKVVHLVGRAITSPAESVRIAFESGRDLFTNDDGIADTFSKQILSAVVGAIFAAASIALSAVAYIVFFPLLIKLLVANAPQAVATVVSWIPPEVVTFLVNASATATSTVIGPLFQALALLFTQNIAPLVIGAAAILGIASATGAAVDPIVETIAHKAAPASVTTAKVANELGIPKNPEMLTQYAAQPFWNASIDAAGKQVTVNDGTTLRPPTAVPTTGV